MSKKLKVLLIDDDNQNLPDLYQLMGHDHDYTHALTVDEGLAVIAGGEFDVVFLDNLFYSSSGITYAENRLEEIRAALGDTPLIMWSNDFNDDKARMYGVPRLQKSRNPGRMRKQQARELVKNLFARRIYDQLTKLFIGVDQADLQVLLMSLVLMKELPVGTRIRTLHVNKGEVIFLGAIVEQSEAGTVVEHDSSGESITFATGYPCLPVPADDAGELSGE